MRHLGRLLGYGFATWVIALAISFLIYPLKQAGDPLFETVMTLVLTALAVAATGVRFRGLEGGYIREGIFLGGVLLLVNVALDLPLFLFGPMARPLGSYMRDIGYTYLVYPIVTIGTAMLVTHVRRVTLVAQAPPEGAADPEPAEAGHATEPALS